MRFISKRAYFQSALVIASINMWTTFYSFDNCWARCHQVRS